ncbi:MAG: endonuclease/exonuclease/phosphatase family protein [Candidatus Omnitrophica bacterium]|nr:endonuclease/exonuclease/phosphatase family protein [Candidatus Omnitrophota bacterium]
MISAGLRPKRRHWARAFRRPRWLAAILGLESQGDVEANPGLLMIQIDGLGHDRLMRALREGRMPFLKKLIASEGFSLNRMYSGLPSSTPAVQAAIFYGVDQAVPAFSFRDHHTGRMFVMNDPDSAACIEARLKERHRGLLEEGSAYTDIFTGGARESHWCVSSMGWSALRVLGKPWHVFWTVVFNAGMIVRILWAVAIETALSVMDFFRGVLSGQNLLEELKFIFLRVAASAFLKEFVAGRASVDIERGLRVVHVNFFGYDEQAHHRGPDSRLALWALRGIDDAVRRLWQAAHCAGVREYGFWVYSDHGQEEVVSLADTNGRSVSQSVCEVVSAVTGHPAAECDVAAIGPLGFVYIKGGASPQHLKSIAEELIVKVGIPLVAVSLDNAARVWTARGQFVLPRDRKEVFGASHPYLEEVCRDFMRLLQHPDKGDLLIGGWVWGVKPVGFQKEHGTHGGPGPGETMGFALLPRDVRPEKRRRMTLKEIRAHALFFLKTRDRPKRAASEPGVRRSPECLRVLTYNVHRFRSIGDEPSLRRIEKILYHHEPDVICLQEAFLCEGNSQGEDLRHLADRLGMSHFFLPLWGRRGCEYGNAILSIHPMTLVRGGTLPEAPRDILDRERRGILWAAVRWRNVEWQVLTTHLSLSPAQRSRQADECCGPRWIAAALGRGPVVLCGDLNDLPGSAPFQFFHSVLKDARAPERRRRDRTWPSPYPVARIDHVFVGPGVGVRHYRVFATTQEKRASDHLPVCCDLTIPRAGRAVIERAAQ